MNAFSNFTLADAAVSTGLPVFPCNDHKRPVTANGFKDATVNAAAIRMQFRHAGMIGVPTGAATGLVVIDVDVKDQDRDGRIWILAHQEAIPPTRIHKTASGGLHYLFKMPNGVEIRNSNDDIADGIDVRGEGGYVIWPGSPGYSVLDDADPAEMPAWLVVACLNANSKTNIETPRFEPQPIRVPAEPITDGGTPYGLAALQRECDGIRRAPFGSQEHTLNAACLKIGSLVAGGELDEGRATAELRAAGCSMPSQARRDPWRPADIDAKVRRGVADGKRQGRSAPDTSDQPLIENPIAAPLVAKLRAEWDRERSKPKPVTKAIMDVDDGILSRIVEYMEATAISPQPFLSLAAAICAVGALAGRRYRTTTDLRTNIYAIGIADSGAGKDHARKVVKNLFAAAGLTAYLGGEDIASGTAVNTALGRHPSILFQVDEFGDWMREILGKNAPAHKKLIAQRFKTAYSSANTWMPGMEYADQSKTGRPREDIHEPCVCLYGTTTPAQFWSAIAGASLHDGLMARFLVFASPCSYPDERDDPELLPPPDDLIEALQALSAGVDGGGNLTGMMSSSVKPTPYTVPETPGAVAMRKALRKEQLQSQREAEGTYVTAIAGRMAENAMKLALIRSVSRHPHAPQITEADVAWGRAMSMHCIDTLLQEADRHVSNSEFETKLNKALDIIRRFGPVSRSEMYAKGFKFPEREAADIIRTLTEGGAIAEMVSTKSPKGGRPTVRYVVSEYRTSILSRVDDNSDDE